MPRIMCPNCGTTINLENRRKIDFDLIKNAVKRKPLTLTQLLHVTRLSRKTLSLRLKDLCTNDILVKNEGFYKLNGALTFENNCKVFEKRISRMLNDKKVRVNLTLIALFSLSLFTGYVLATLFIPQTQLQKANKEPEIIGTLTTFLKIYNAKDLYTWQVTIRYNQNELKVLEVLQGDFLGDDQIFANASDSFPNILMMYGSLRGQTFGRCGNGTLAIIVFGYFTNNYTKPEIILSEGLCKTILLDSTPPFGSEIPFELSNSASGCTRLVLAFPED